MANGPWAHFVIQGQWALGFDLFCVPGPWAMGPGCLAGVLGPKDQNPGAIVSRSENGLDWHFMNRVAPRFLQ